MTQLETATVLTSAVKNTCKNPKIQKLYSTTCKDEQRTTCKNPKIQKKTIFNYMQW